MPLPYAFLFRNDKLLLKPECAGPDALPRLPETVFPQNIRRHCLGLFKDTPCFALSLDEPEAGRIMNAPEAKRTAPPPIALQKPNDDIPGAGKNTAVNANPHRPAPDPLGNYREYSLREAYDILGEELYLVAGKGRELLHWDASSRFCPACGKAMRPATKNSKRCPACGREVFPHITLAVLVFVRKGEEALLVRAHNFTGPFYGLVAGYLEPGETLEECAVREVREETSLEIGPPRYFGSQPWPYPSGLMAGFVADYRAGEIALLDGELVEAAFFSRQAPPPLPHPLSLARRMIDWWLAGAQDFTAV